MDLVFENISKKYKGKSALEDFSASLTNGIYGLLGENGAGKTTLISILVGILKSDTGNIYLNGQNAHNLGKNFLSQIGYLPQYPEFYKEFTVLDFLRYICVMKEIPKMDSERKIQYLLNKVNLAPAKDKKIGALSGGMRQRLGIAMAVIGEPSILILDEPTAGLDPQERIRFRNLIAEFSENRIVILATHIVSDVEFIANEVLLLQKGKLLRQDTPQALATELDGKVWEVRLNSTQELPSFQQYRMSNMQRQENQILLRLLSKDCPCESAIPLKANLEDVFLYHQEENEVESYGKYV